MLRYLCTFCCWIILFELCLGFGAGGGKEKSWTYYFISTNHSSTNEDLFKIDLQVERVSRGVYGITGTLVIKMDVDDNTEIEAQAFRSATGSNDYTKLPFSVERQHLYSFFNSFYKNIIMKSIKDCSNMPQFEEEFEPPLEKKVYTFDQCQVSTDALPQHMQEGYYKVELKGFGPVDYYIEFVLKIETSM